MSFTLNYNAIMSKEYISKIARELNIYVKQVEATARLLDEGATVPFIARYRKETTGSLDEVAITTIRNRLTQLEELNKRREAILKSLIERGKLTDDLKYSILRAETMSTLEDIYLPYRPKKRTRATIAREKGLEPLAELIFAQKGIDPAVKALSFVNPERSVKTVEDALQGARDIIAEWVSENKTARNRMRKLFHSKGMIRSKAVSGKEEEGVKYKDYYDWEESVTHAPSHRILAMMRGEKEKFLRLHILPPEEEAISILEALFFKGMTDHRRKEYGEDRSQVKVAIQDSYKRLLSASMETEIRSAIKKCADEEAIKVFTKNLRQLLLAPPLGQKNLIAIDPGLRTGCKLVCLDKQGKLLHNDTIFINQSSGEAQSKTAEKIIELCKKYEIEAIAIGNGTGGRETEVFIKKLDLLQELQIVMVNEAGASVYSASKAAREEFPDHDVTVRGAISIGRRLMDPLAELVKIEPKSIGVGQYQHDVDQVKLKHSLDDVVISCTNAVGVEVNTASKELLTYVSGLGPQLSSNIVKYRNEHGPFRSRDELKNVPKLGPKVFEQSAGFLRIWDGDNPLDRSAVHPESYPIVDQIAKDHNCSVDDLIQREDIRESIDIKRYITDKVGLPTLNDIMSELAKPGRDPRKKFEAFSFKEGVEKIEDVKPGMRLPGVITNITSFGAFVDIGVHQDGLVHISQLSDHYVKNPNDVVKVHQKVIVTVLDIDPIRKRISLSLKKSE